VDFKEHFAVVSCLGKKNKPWSLTLNLVSVPGLVFGVNVGVAVFVVLVDVVSVLVVLLRKKKKEESISAGRVSANAPAPKWRPKAEGMDWRFDADRAETRRHFTLVRKSLLLPACAFVAAGKKGKEKKKVRWHFPFHFTLLGRAQLDA
jgi:hypothetical protein